ncbi:MAG: hypothetical protein ABI968_11930 [Acidobacteriota bacterium]
MILAVLAVLWALAGPGRAEATASEALAALREAIETGDFQVAVALGERLVKSESESSEAHDLLGRAYGRTAESTTPLSQIHLARKARAEFARAVALDPANAEALADLTTYDMRAPVILHGSRTRAGQEAEQLLRLDASRGHELLGALAEGRDDVAAEKEYRLALEAAPSTPRARRALSGFLVRRKRFAEADVLWRPLRERNAADPLAAYELAGIALASGEDLGAASEALEGSLKADAVGDPRRAEIHFRLGQVWSRLGRRTEARSNLSEALRLEPHQRTWQKELARIGR